MEPVLGSVLSSYVRFFLPLCPVCVLSLLKNKQVNKNSLAIKLIHCSHFTDKTEDQKGNVTSPKVTVIGRAGQELEFVTEEIRDLSVTLLGSRP